MFDFQKVEKTGEVLSVFGSFGYAKKNEPRSLVVVVSIVGGCTCGTVWHVHFQNGWHFYDTTVSIWK